jgi:hypothetical protein
MGHRNLDDQGGHTSRKRQRQHPGHLHGRPGATTWSRDALVVQRRGDARQGGDPSCCSAWITGEISAARLRAMLARAMALARLPFRKASLVRVLLSLPLFVLPGIRCQNSTRIRDDDAVVRAGRYAATRVNLWMVVGLRFAVTAMDRILTLKLVDGSDGLTT